jgi:NADPH:quinone reductase
MKIHAWQVNEWCQPEALDWAEVDLPEPGPGQVRVRNRAAALNFFDILQIQGKYQVKPPFPFTPGAEIAGIVDAIGPGVTAWQRGDKVLGIPEGSGFAQQTVLDAERVFPIPEGMDWAQAAALPIVYHTSYYALTGRAQLRAGEWLLVHAGAGGTGMSAIQLGKAFGARVIATAGSPEKLAFAARQGAGHTLDYRDPAWVDEVNRLTAGRGADVIYDPVGGDIFDLSIKCLAPGGRLLVVGFAGGRIPSIAANRILLRNISIAGVYWGAQVRADPGFTARTQQSIEALWKEGKIRPEVSATWPLSRLPLAMRALADRRIAGKAVVLNDT